MTSGDAEEGPVINANPQTNGSQCFLGEWWSACPHSSHFSLEGLGGGKAADTESYMSLMTACRGCIIKQVQDKWCTVILIINKNLHEVSILSFHFNAIFEPFSDIHLLETHLGETSSLLFLLSTEGNMIQVWKRLKRALTELHPRHLIPFQQQAWEQ